MILTLVELFILSHFIQHATEPCVHMSNHTFLPSVAMNICGLTDHFLLFYTFLLLFSPYLLFLGLHDISIVYVWSILSIGILATILSAISLQSYHTLLLIVILSVFVVTMVIDAQIHKVQMFLTARKLGNILQQNERNASQQHAQEMRSMIANVAHDLKTVSLTIESVSSSLELTFSVSLSLSKHSHLHLSSPD
jgi:prepilin signal peptidase PulO-like enzyme (type II secretory pathway)